VFKLGGAERTFLAIRLKRPHIKALPSSDRRNLLIRNIKAFQTSRPEAEFHAENGDQLVIGASGRGRLRHVAHSASHHRDGTVTTGDAVVWPVSASENRIIRNVNLRLLAMSVSSIQYQ
jgi:hypothetical protein